MSGTDPYRHGHDLRASIAPDRRPLVAATLGTVIGALLATSVTLAWVRRTPIEVSADCTDHRAVVLANPAPPPACKLDPASAVLLDRNPLPELPRYPDAILRASLGDVAHNTAVVDMETCASLEDVRSFYRSHVKGLELDGERSRSDEHMFTFIRNDPHDADYIQVFDVRIHRFEDVTFIHLSSSLPRTKKPLPSPNDRF